MSVKISIIYLLPLIISIHGLNTRIFGGSNAPEGRFKYHVHMNTLRGNGNYCGGSIIHKRWILTAGHCFKNDEIRFIDAIVGSTARTGEGGTIYHVDKRIVHEEYDDAKTIRDIALLRVDKDIEFNDKVQPVILPRRNTVINDFDNAILTGFGRISDHTHPFRLQQAFIKMFTYETCKNIEQRITDREICTLPFNNIGPCAGDSGGPLVNGNGVQVGIHSHAYGNGLQDCAKIPEIYTKVSSYLDWIEDKIRLNTEWHRYF